MSIFSSRRGFLTSLLSPWKNASVSVEYRALLIGIKYTGNDFLEPLPSAHRDVDTVKNFLLQNYAFLNSNITVMKDSCDVPPHLQPTHKNLTRELKKFIQPNKRHVQYVVFFAGHSGQMDCEPEDDTELDNLNEYVLASDGRTISSKEAVNHILDNDLKLWLVDTVKPGSALLAIMDTCHSGTILDLPHDKCHRVCRCLAGSYRRLIRNAIELGLHAADTLGMLDENKGPQGVFKAIISVLEECGDLGLSTTDSRTPAETPKGFCRGRCPRRRSHDQPRIICLSACKDHEICYERATMTKDILEFLSTLMIDCSHRCLPDRTERNKNPRMKDLMRAISSDALLSGRRLEANVRRNANVDLKTLYRKPQLSSLYPLDMEERLFNIRNLQTL